MHRTGRRSGRGGSGPARQCPPLRAGLGRGLRRTGIVKPTHRRAVEVRLVDRLAGAPVAQFGRAVGRAHEQRNARVVRLDNGRMKIRRRRTRRAAHDRRHSRREADAERPKRRGTFVDHDVDARCVRLVQARATTACCENRATPPRGAPRPARTRRPRSTRTKCSRRADAFTADFRDAARRARSRVHADRDLVGRCTRDPRRWEHRDGRRRTGPRDVRADRTRDRTARASAGSTSVTRWAAACACGSRSTDPISYERSCW